MKNSGYIPGCYRWFSTTTKQKPRKNKVRRPTFFGYVQVLWGHFLFTSSDTFAAGCIVQLQHTQRKTEPPKFPRLE